MSTRFKSGSIVFDRRRGSWRFLWWADGKRQSKTLGTLQQLPSKNAASRAAQHLRETLWEHGTAVTPPTAVTVANLVERYRVERMPTRYSTRRSYDVWLCRYVLPQWGNVPITCVQPRAVELWLQSLPLSPKSRADVRAMLSTLWDFAMWSGSIPVQRNPMSLVAVRGSSQRIRQPRSLTVEEFRQFVVQLREPFRTVALLCVSLGLRISECLALKWSDVNWLDSKLQVQRGIVTGRVSEVKTAGSRKAMPLAPETIGALRSWKFASQFGSGEDWVFASPVQLGRLPWSYPRTWRIFRDAAIAAGLGAFGTHALRHTYRSWLDAAGTPLAVQQKMMRHADIRTTMNIYGDVVTDAMTVASGKVANFAFHGSPTDREPS